MLPTNRLHRPLRVAHSIGIGHLAAGADSLTARDLQSAAHVHDHGVACQCAGRCDAALFNVPGLRLASRRGFLRAALAGAALAGATPLIARAVTDEEIAAAEREQAELERLRQEEQTLLVAAQAREGALQQQLAVIDRQRFAAVERLRDVNRQLETVELEVYDINASIANLNRALARETDNPGRPRPVPLQGWPYHDPRNGPLLVLVLRGARPRHPRSNARWPRILKRSKRCVAAARRCSCERPTWPRDSSKWTNCARKRP